LSIKVEKLEKRLDSKELEIEKLKEEIISIKKILSEKLL